MMFYDFLNVLAMLVGYAAVALFLVELLIYFFGRNDEH